MEWFKKIQFWPALSFLAVSIGSLLGFILSYWFLIMIPVGIFVPGFLRRIGLLQDADEFFVHAQNTAAWTAFSSVSLLGMLFFILDRTNKSNSTNASDIILVIMVFGYVIYAACYLFQFWDGKKAGQILLWTITAAWSAFIVLSEWGNPLGLVMELLVVITPMMSLAVLCRFFPRIIGILSLAAAISSIFFFNLLDFSKGGNLFVLAAITLPFVVVCIGMFVKRKEVKSESLKSKGEEA